MNNRVVGLSNEQMPSPENRISIQFNVTLAIVWWSVYCV